MSDEESSYDPIRFHVRSALKHYATFFAHLAGGEKESAEAVLRSIQRLDQSVEKSLSREDCDAYYEKKDRLMKIFHHQLMTELKGQVQDQVLRDATELLQSLNSPKESERC